MTDTLAIIAIGLIGAILGNGFWYWWKRRGRASLGPAPAGYKVVFEGGRGGWVTYREGKQSCRFKWELAGSKPPTLVSWISVPAAKMWPTEVPWAPDRRDEILGRVAREIVRQACPSCRFVIGADRIEMHMKDQ